MIVDEQHYSTLALNLLHGHGFAWEPGKLTSLRPPLYPGFMALLWKISGTESLLVIRATQVVLSLANVYVLFRIGLLLFTPRVAILAATGFCFYPSFLAFNYFLLTEVLFTFLLSLLILGYVMVVRTGRTSVAWATGGVLGLAVLTRSVLWIFPLILCPLIFWNTIGSKKQRLWATVAVFLGYAAVITPWAVRNTRLQGVFTVVDTMGGVTLRMGNYEHTDLNRAWDPATLHGRYSIYQDLRREHPDVSSWTEGQKEKWALRKTLIYMLDHPGLTLERAGIKFANFWGLERVVIAGWQHKVYQPPRWFTILGTFLIPLFYMTTMLLACLGIFLSPPDDRRAHGFLLLLIGFIAGMHTLTFGHERYHLPLIPILLVYAAAAVIQKSWWNFREGMQKLSAPITGCMLLLFIWGWEVLVVDADRIKALFTSLFG